MSENPSAFPYSWQWEMPDGGKMWKNHDGMSLRDWFAGQALAGLVVGCAGMLGREFSAYAEGHCNAVLVERAYALADAMLSARSNQGDQ